MFIFLFLLQALGFVWLYSLFNSAEFASLGIPEALKLILFAVFLFIFVEYKTIMAIFIIWYLISQIFLSMGE